MQPADLATAFTYNQVYFMLIKLYQLPSAGGFAVAMQGYCLQNKQVFGHVALGLWPCRFQSVG